MIRSVRGLVGALAMACALGCSDDGDAADGTGGGGGARVTFTSDVYPILRAKCSNSGCHDTATAGLPGHAAANVDDAYDAVIGLSYAGGPVYERILVRTSATDPFSVMPPMSTGCMGGLGQPDCLSQAEYDTIEAWVEQGHPR